MNVIQKIVWKALQMATCLCTIIFYNKSGVIKSYISTFEPKVFKWKAPFWADYFIKSCTVCLYINLCKFILVYSDDKLIIVDNW